MNTLVARIVGVTLVSLFSSGVIADLSNYPVSDFTVVRDNRIELLAYYTNLERTIGSLPDVVPFEADAITVKSGSTIVEIARKHTIDNMDPVHLAAALYLKNKNAFLDDDVNKIIAGSRLLLPTVSYINEARNLYEDALNLEKVDKSTGLPMYKKPEPKIGSKVLSPKNQGWQWKKFSGNRYIENTGVLSEGDVIAGNDNGENGGFISWEESGTTHRVSQQPVPASDHTYYKDGVEYCSYCDLPMSVVRRGRLSPDIRQGVLNNKQQKESSSPSVDKSHLNSVTVLGNLELKACSKAIITDNLLNQKSGQFQLLTLSDGSRCIY